MRRENRNCWICKLILQRINLWVPNLVHTCYVAVTEIYTVLHAGVPVLAPSGVFLVLSTQLWGSHRSGVLWPFPGSEGLWPHSVKGKLSSLMHYCFLREPVGLRSCNSFKRFKSVAFMKCYFHRLYFLGILLICSVMYTPHIAEYLWPIGMQTSTPTTPQNETFLLTV